MPLNEELYCHQQICIPPTFPYLLRQYAKAAIRSQPTDLLKWSTAYFRCLSLNVPPPVKPRLEYPIPRDYLGITPGWLKALNYQLQNCKTVNYRILWDRWFGSCLNHNNLLQILCLGGFNNPDKIPWNKFLGLCAGFLNDNLTQTMIMFCEIITEEPEGGSAMITLETFLEVYKFLAMIDASQPQILPNLYFTDDYLGLEAKEKKKRKKKRKVDLSLSAESSERTIEEIVEEEEIEESLKGESSVISCPDIDSDEALKERDPNMVDLDEPMFTPGQKESTDRISDELSDEEIKDELSEKILDEEQTHKTTGEEEDEEKPDGKDKEIPPPPPESKKKSKDQKEDKKESKSGHFEDHKDQKNQKDDHKEQKDDHKDKKDDQKQDHKEKKEDIKDKKEDVEDKHEKIEEKDDEEEKDDHKDEEKDDFDDKDILLADEDIVLESPAALDEPIDVPEVTAEEKIQEEDKKEEILPEESELKESTAGDEHMDYQDVDELERAIKLEYGDISKDDKLEKVEEILPEDEEEHKIEEVSVPAVPGIGPKVPDHLVEAVERYLKRVAACEHGMTMPRHIRHYCCPPLEVLDEHSENKTL